MVNESESSTEVDIDTVSADEWNSKKQDKVLAEYYYYAGLINFAIGYDENLKNAIGNYQKAARYDSENAEYVSALGEAYYQSDNREMALRTFDRAILIDKAASDYYNEGYHLVWKAYVMEDINEAIEIYEESLKFRDDYAYTYRRLAELYTMENDDASVKNVYYRAINNCTDNAEFYYARGEMCYYEGDYYSTIEDMEMAMERDGSYTAYACYYIGLSYHALQNYSVAYEYYQLAKDNGNDRSDEIDAYMQDCSWYMEE